MISHFAGHTHIPNQIGRGQMVPFRPGYGSNVMQEGLGGRLGDGVVDSVGSFIQSQAAQGATSAVTPYIMGALALAAGALLISLVALSDAKSAMKSKGLSGARRRR